jgi:pantetheine-phosphate adenylyltransferase
VSRLAIYPGTFDPITNGHLDIVQRASHIFDEIVICIADNVNKTPLFSLEERCDLAISAVAGSDHISVETFGGLLAEFARMRRAAAIIRGLRAVKDFEYEFQMALMNKSLYPEVETVFLMPSERFTYVNSSIVREVARLGGDVTSYVPLNVAAALKEKYDHNRSSG